MTSKPKNQELSNELLEAYLKEWELCQDNLKRHNDWAWQVGAIFIALSLGAIWASTQIEKVAQHIIVVWVLALFSTSTMILWGVICWRARFYLRWTRERLWRIESMLRKASNLKYENSEKLLHTLIKEKDSECSCPPHVKWIPLIFISMVILAWVVLLLHYGGFLF